MLNVYLAVVSKLLIGINSVNAHKSPMTQVLLLANFTGEDARKHKTVTFLRPHLATVLEWAQETEFKHDLYFLSHIFSMTDSSQRKPSI